MATIEELSGIVKGLADVVKSQLTNQHDAQEANRQHVEALAKTVADLATNSPSSSHVDTLKLPQVVLPRYTGKPDEQLDRFPDQLTTLLKYSGVPAKHWTIYLKQQVQQDLRAYDSVVFAEEECKRALREDPTNITIEQYETYFNLVKASLIKKRGKPKDERIRELLQVYYNLQQSKAEPVSTFAHRFCDIQHELEKCIPGIHYTGTNDDIELRHAFLIKLRPEIGKALMSRDTKYSSLSEVIEAANRFEQSFPPLPLLSADYVDPFREDKAMLKPKSCYNRNQPGHSKETVLLCTILGQTKNENKHFVEILPVKPKCASSGINELFLAAYFLIINASFIDNMCVWFAKRRDVNNCCTKKISCLHKVNWKKSYQVSFRHNLIVFALNWKLYFQIQNPLPHPPPLLTITHQPVIIPYLACHPLQLILLKFLT